MKDWKRTGLFHSSWRWYNNHRFHTLGHLHSVVNKSRTCRLNNINVSSLEGITWRHTLITTAIVIFLSEGINYAHLRKTLVFCNFVQQKLCYIKWFPKMHDIIYKCMCIQKYPNVTIKKYFNGLSKFSDSFIIRMLHLIQLWYFKLWFTYTKEWAKNTWTKSLLKGLIIRISADCNQWEWIEPSSQDNLDWAIVEWT